MGKVLTFMCVFAVFSTVAFAQTPRPVNVKDIVDIEMLTHSEISDMLESIGGGDWEDSTVDKVESFVKEFTDDFGQDLDEDGQPQERGESDRAKERKSEEEPSDEQEEQSEEETREQETANA